MNGIEIIDAPWGPRDVVPTLSNVIGTAFSDLEVSRYLIPDDTVRAQILARHLGLQVNWARSNGQLLTDSGLGSAAVWFTVPETGLPDIPNYEATRREVCGPYTERVAEFEKRMHDRHPLGRKHWYLALLAVRPELQGKGLGSAHLAYQLAFLKEQGYPAYLEASDLLSAKLYEQFGFVAHGEPFSCGIGGPLVRPMWWEPVWWAPGSAPMAHGGGES